MKTTFTIILTVCYAWLAAGVGINQHFCGGEFSGIQLYSKSGSCCCGTMQEPEGCCEDKTEFFKLELDQKVPVTNTFRFFNSETELRAIDTDDECIIDQKEVANPTNKPPPKNPSPIYLLFSQFIFYG